MYWTRFIRKIPFDEMQGIKTTQHPGKLSIMTQIPASRYSGESGVLAKYI